MSVRIEDYAMIGDMRTAALVGRNGSIDWLCLPRFDSGSCFAALLGKPEHGHWQIAPRHDYKTKRRYRENTLILETEFKTKTGRAVLIDFMPTTGEHCSVVRVVQGLEGTVEMQSDLVIRFDYGITIPWVNRLDETTLSAVAGPNRLLLRTPSPLHGEELKTVGRFKVQRGEVVPFVLTYSSSYVPAPLGLSVESALAETEKFWRDWTAKCRAKGKWCEQINRSLITLKGLSYRPTGGIVAAATTSLPEQIGSERNWDYRYCWLRDATFTLLAFLNAGYHEEADAWQNWLVRAVAGSPGQFQTMYGVAGERRLDEWTIPWLPGYENSSPVRIGNAAALQRQLDIYGELADAFSQAALGGLPAVPRRSEIRDVFLDHLSKIWRQPDEGIWEIRGKPRHFVHSKVMAWVAFDRAWRSAKSRGDKKNAKRWKRVADTIHREVCRRGIDPRRKCFVQCYESEEVDASLLMMAIVGFLPPTDKRIHNTVREIEKRLKVDGLVLRYETKSGVDGLPEGEGAFLACSFWLVDNYVLMGRKRKAVALFESLLKLCNDVGLLSEEYDPRAKRMLGNFPQAFSHVALVNSAFNLMDGKDRRKVGPRAQRRNAARTAR